MTEKIIVTGRWRALGAVRVLCDALRGCYRIATPAALLEAIMGYMIDSIDRFADDVAAKLDRIEERILADGMGEGRQLLGRIRRTTVRLHRQFAILCFLTQRFELDLCQKLSLRIGTTRLRQRLDWLDTEIVALRDRAYLLQEEVTIKTAEQTNRNLHVLAVVHHPLHAGKPDRWNLRHECRQSPARAERQRIPMADGDYRHILSRGALAAQALGHSQALAAGDGRDS
jgi:zinc transporter